MTMLDIDVHEDRARRLAAGSVRRISLTCRLLIEDRHRRVLLARYFEAGEAGEAGETGETGGWRLPGGPVLDREPMALAATRRLHEQLGILVLPHCIISVLDTAADLLGGNRLAVTYAASILSGEAVADPSTGIAEAAWFPRGDLPEAMAADAAEALASMSAIGFR